MRSRRRARLRALAGEAPEAQAGQAVFAFAGDEEVGEESTSSSITPSRWGMQLGPIFAAGRGDGRGDQAEVAALVVGADEPQAVAMVDGVFVLVLARG